MHIKVENKISFHFDSENVWKAEFYRFVETDVVVIKQLVYRML